MATGLNRFPPDSNVTIREFRFYPTDCCSDFDERFTDRSDIDNAVMVDIPLRREARQKHHASQRCRIADASLFSNFLADRRIDKRDGQRQNGNEENYHPLAACHFRKH